MTGMKHPCPPAASRWRSTPRPKSKAQTIANGRRSEDHSPTEVIGDLPGLPSPPLPQVRALAHARKAPVRSRTTSFGASFSYAHLPGEKAPGQPKTRILAKGEEREASQPHLPIHERDLIVVQLPLPSRGACLVWLLLGPARHSWTYQYGPEESTETVNSSITTRWRTVGIDPTSYSGVTE